MQARWAHLNDLYSPLTRAQSLLLDGHFVVEQTARNRGGLLMSFNGSGGIWRRQSIEDAGGWQSDTMTEDLDLSYRAQLAGWQFLYLPDVETPSELPPQMEAFKQQQARWAQGSIQCMRKLGWSVLRGDFTWFQKMMALLHMSAYLTQPLVIFMLLASLPVLLLSTRMPEFLAAATIASLGAPVQYTIGQSQLHGDWERRMLYLPVLAVVGVGSAWSTTRAVWTGLTSWGGTFGRTPKFRIEGRDGRWRDSVYRMVPDRAFVGEILLALYAIITIVVALTVGNIAVIPYLLLYAAGFGYVAFIGIQQKWQHTQ